LAYPFLEHDQFFERMCQVASTGQDENPASRWYENEIATWWNGHYYPMIDGPAALKQPGSMIWRLDN
jgi:acyl-homoserine lactone acylase PvdQ